MTKRSGSFLPFALPDIGEEEIDEAIESLRSGWLTTGPKTKRFEEAFASFLGVPYALAVNSGTAALHLALEAIGLQEGEFVITTPFTFTATAEVIRYFGAHPLFVDIDADTMNIDPGQVAEAAAMASRQGKKVRAILPVHFAGLSCDMDALKEAAGRYSLKIVEDAAHAFPASYRGNKIGTIGDLTAFSFYATKPLATGEGGMVTTCNEEYAARIRTMRLHGISRDVWDRYSAKKPNWYYEVIAPGYKYNLTDLAASIGIHQLGKADRLRKRREEIASMYTGAFAGLPVLLPPTPPDGDTHSWHLYVLRLRLERLRIGRDRFIESMAERGIGTSVHFIPLHLHPYWREKYGFHAEDFPGSLAAYRCCVSLPIYSRMTDGDVVRVIETVKEILDGSAR
jgi:dTDP-4-amino-4,6-dideoxygalactose transaminase